MGKYDDLIGSLELTIDVNEVLEEAAKKVEKATPTETRFFYIIKVYEGEDRWHNNAYIENSSDAIAVAKFYKEQLGYEVQLWHKEKDVSSLLDVMDGEK